jgi:hypothetical protein
MNWYLLLAAAAEEGSKDPDGGWAAYLQQYGGWATTVGCVIAIIYLWRFIVSEFRTQQTPEQKRLAREAKAAAQKTEEERQQKMYDQIHKDLFDELHDKLVPLIAAVEANSKSADELKTEAQQIFNDAIRKKDEVITELARQKDEVGKEAMAKMEDLYGQMLGLVERVIGAAGTLKEYTSVLAEIKKKFDDAGDPSDSGGST